MGAAPKGERRQSVTLVNYVPKGLADLDSNELSEKKMAEEWLHRRLAAQFISRMGGLLKNKYISKNSFFTVVPEVQRLIIVLEPIDNAIIEYFVANEKFDFQKEWDRPMRKEAPI